MSTKEWVWEGNAPSHPPKWNLDSVDRNLITIYFTPQLTTVCYINSHLQTTSEKKCRFDLEHFLTHQTISTPHPYDIIFSHVPLDYLSPATYTNGLSTVNIKTKILSSLHGMRFIFSGHIHHSLFSTHSRPLSTGHVWSHRLAKDSVVHEITVPTCSYRMGERYMGVGAAILSKFRTKKLLIFHCFICLCWDIVITVNQEILQML